jgi:hypothetical protein
MGTLATVDPRTAVSANGYPTFIAPALGGGVEESCAASLRPSDLAMTTRAAVVHDAPARWPGWVRFGLVVVPCAASWACVGLLLHSGLLG